MRVLISILIWLYSLQIFAVETISLSPEQIENLGIKLGKLETIKSVPLVEASAKVSIPPSNEYMVSASFAGLISQLFVSVGDEVKKGQPLAIIKSPDLLALQQHHLSSINDLHIAETDYKRDKQLYTEGVISERRWLKTKANYQVYLAHYNETRQLLEIAGIPLQDIKTFEKTHELNSQMQVLAPISGVILQRMVSTGERVDALAPLFRVADLNELWLDISVPQQYISRIHQDNKVIILGSGVSASIFLIGKNVDERNQTVLVRAVLDEAAPNIRLGQTVKVQISYSESLPMFKVANTALAQSGGIYYLFKRTQTGFELLPVQILGREGNESIISGDLQIGEVIAVKGAVALKANFLGLGENE